MTSPTFRTLEDVRYGVPEQVSPLVRRVIAENPSRFTYRGTGTYILGRHDVVVIDPGPRLDSHCDALAAALSGERVRAILVTHCHSDHSPLAAWLHAETGAPTYAYGPHPPPDPKWEALVEDDAVDDGASGDDASGQAIEHHKPIEDHKPIEMEEAIDFDFAPSMTIADGDRVPETPGLSISAIHTPGHTSNHMCWALGEERALFTGDHVMGWSTTVVAPPDGDMAQYIASLRKVADRDDAVLWPTHGPPRDDAREYVSALVDHRLERERGVLAALDEGRTTIHEIVELLYADVRKELHKAAGMSVWSHLLKLVSEGQVQVEGSGRPALRARYRPIR
jgi:glyoxylase-like metal-dependent hydrolase (beta-lactamase superfamily II)